jgi:hypothetical protein
MVARSDQQISPAVTPEWHNEFIEWIPRIRRCAESAFWKARGERRDDLIHEVIANALVAYVRLIVTGKRHLAFPTPLGRYAVAQVREGRRIGSRLKRRDALTEHRLGREGIHLERIDRYDEDEQAWQQLVVEDKRSSPAEVAIFRLDFHEWLERLSESRRRIALALAGGESAKGVAEMIGITTGRDSQVRRWLKENWDSFQSDASTKKTPRLTVT